MCAIIYILQNKATEIFRYMHEFIPFRTMVKSPIDYFSSDYAVSFPCWCELPVHELTQTFFNIAAKEKSNISMLLKYFECLPELVNCVEFYERFPKLSGRFREDTCIEMSMKSLVQDILHLACNEEIGINEDIPGIISNVLKNTVIPDINTFAYMITQDPQVIIGVCRNYKLNSVDPEGLGGEINKTLERVASLRFITLVKFDKFYYY